MADRDTPPESAQREREVVQVAARLAHEFDKPQREPELRPAVESEFKRYDTAPVRDFVPVLVERRIRAELRALARV